MTSVGQSPNGLRVGGKEISINQMAATRIYMPRRLDTPSIAAWKLIKEKGSLAQLSGKVVIIGLDGAVGPTIKTARGELSLPEAHALIARQIAGGEATKRPASIGYLEALSVMLLGAAAIMWSQRLDFWKAVGVATLASVALGGVSLAAFDRRRISF